MIQRRLHESLSSGSRSTIRNCSKNGWRASSNPLNRLVAVPRSMIWGSDCKVCRSFQLKSSSSPHNACRFSTIRTSFRPSRSAAARTAARADSSIFVSLHRAANAECVARSSWENFGLLFALAIARWKIASIQKSASVKISWLSSVNRTGNRCLESVLFNRISAPTRASSIVFPRPRGPMTSTCWQDGELILPRRTSSTSSSSRLLTTNCSTTSVSD